MRLGYASGTPMRREKLGGGSSADRPAVCNARNVQVLVPLFLHATQGCSGLLLDSRMQSSLRFSHCLDLPDNDHLAAQNSVAQNLALMLADVPVRPLNR